MATKSRNDGSGGGILVPVLLSVLAAAAISTGGFGAGYGAGILRYEVLGDASAVPPQQGQAQQQSASTVLQSSAAGPNLIVENGTITWMSEAWLANGGQSVPGFEAQITAPAPAPSAPEQPAENAPNNTQTPEPSAPKQTTTQKQTPEQGSSSNPNNPPSKAPTSLATGNSNTSSGKTQNGGNINPSSPANAKTQAGGSNQTSNLDWPEGKFLASKNGSVYHRMYCQKGATGAVNIKEENKIWFDSEEEAIAARKKRCGNCW